MNRDTWAATVATIAVVAVIVLGLRVLGGPGTQRLVQSELHTLQKLRELAEKIKFTWDSSGKVLPANLERFPNSVKQDPVTNKSLIHRPKSNSEYELCATLLQIAEIFRLKKQTIFGTHPKGDCCFELDAAQQVPQVPYYY